VSRLLDLIVRAMGELGRDEHAITPEILARVLAKSSEEGVLESVEADILSEIVELGGIRVREIMTPRVDALLGLTVETALLAPAAIGFLAVGTATGRAVFGSESGRMSVLLFLAGPLTALPLLWFTAAARRLTLATLGFLQYLAPTGHFLLAVFAYHEPFGTPHFVAFGCIWTALLIYSVDSAMRPRRAAGNGAARPGIE